MASIRKRGERYAVLYRDRSGRQRSETFARRKDAVVRKSEVEVGVRTGDFVSPRDSRVTFGEWFKRWEATRHVSPSRLAADTSMRDVHVLPRWRKVPIDAMTHMELQGWVSELSRKLSPATVGACVKLVRMPLDAAVKEGKLRMNPVHGITLPRSTRRLQTAENVLTGKELATLVEKTPERWQAMIFLMGWLGLRWSEALGLRRKDFNPLRSQISVGNVVVVEVNGKNVIRTGGKTDAAARLLTLPKAVTERLNEHIAAYPGSPEDFLFVTAAGQPPLRTNFNRREFASAIKAAGLADRHITLRQLRHTGASLMLDAGLALQDVQQRMGHSRPSTTFDVYSHLLASRQEAGTAALDIAISSVQRA